MASSHSLTRARLQALGLSRQLTYRITKEVSRWVRHSGKEWTVNRLKALKMEYIHFIGGKVVPSPWIKHHKDGRPSGPFGALFRRFRRPSHITRSLNVLMAYTAYTSLSVTKSQLETFKESVEKDSLYDRAWFASNDEDNSDDLPSIREMCRENSDIGRQQVQALLMETRRGTRTSVFSSNGRQSVPVRRVDLWYTSQWCEAQKLIDHLGLSKSIFQHLPIPGDDPQVLLDMMMSTLGRTDYPLAGSIGFLQEPGFKLRAVANPNRVIQCLLVPLRKEIEDVLRQIPEDCTFDQNKGVKRISKWLSEGRKINSIDLSDATNHFPLHFQMRTLESVVSKDMEQLLHLFEGVSTSRWYYRTPFDSGTVSWTVGQPMGLNPSFSAFALSHHRLVKRCMKSGIEHQDYVILGDDIAIVGDNLCHEYKKALHSYDCPINESKSLSSDTVAEFAGKVITKDGVIHPLKWKGVSSHNFLDIVKGLGERGLSLLTGPQRRVAKIIAPIPEWEGGFGWNPSGYSISERYSRCRLAIARLSTDDFKPYINAGVLTRAFLYNSQALVSDFDWLLGLLLSKKTTPRTGKSGILEILRKQFKFMEESVLDSDDLGNMYLPGVQDPRLQPNQFELILRKLQPLSDFD
jgi:hypothetical protein